MLAHKGLLPFWGVAACAAIGSCVADQLWFLAGRLSRGGRWVTRLRETPPYRRALRLLHSHATGFIFAFRFVYGIRTISPIVIGTSDVPARRFVALNALAAAVWGPLLASIGFLFGKAVDPWLHDLRSVVIAIAAALVLSVGGLVAWRRIGARRG